MASEWAPALLAAGAASSATVGFYMVSRFGPRAQRSRKRIQREQVRVAKRSGPPLVEMLPGILGGVLLYLLTLAMTGKGGLSIAVALGGFMIPGWVKAWQETNRLIQLSEQLNRAIGMISTSLRRGAPLEVALAETASLSAPLGPVLKTLAHSTVMGVTLGQAAEQVRTLPAVTGSTDFQVFATEMVICHERGANIVQAFESLRGVLSARRRYRQQVMQHMGEHLVQALVISGIGLGMLLLFSVLMEDGLRPLLETVIGQIILAISLLGNTFMVRLTHMSILGQLRRL
ncbi:MAG: type II secretion system F family protein [Bacillota bacterium]